MGVKPLYDILISKLRYPYLSSDGFTILASLFVLHNALVDNDCLMRYTIGVTAFIIVLVLRPTPVAFLIFLWKMLIQLIFVLV
jgi:hypothetical protein